MKNERAIWYLIWATFLLLAGVVIVGLLQKSLDTTGVALALCTVLFGTGGGFLLRIKVAPPKNDDKSDEDPQP